MLEDESKNKARLGDEIKIRSAEPASTASSDAKSSSDEEQNAPSGQTQQVQSGKKLKIRGKADAVRLLKELPEDEFLHLLEHSSPEQIQAFLSALTPEEQPLSHLSKKLIERATSIPDEPRGALSIIAWWESRRFLFNLLVGLCGLPTLAIVFFTGLASVSLCIYGTIEYGLLANLCYTAGWICELIARHWWKERARHLGPILFSLGFSFSIFLTLGAGLICILIFLLLRILAFMF